MTPKQARFIAEYLVDLNGTQAAIRAGYAPKTANRTASDLLTNPDIAEELRVAKLKQIAKADLSAVRILEELGRLALGDVREFYTEQGNLKPVGEWTAEMGARVAGVETIIKNAKAGDGATDEVLKLRFWDKTKALDTLAKHFGLLIEKVEMEHSGGVVLKWKD